MPGPGVIARTMAAARNTRNSLESSIGVILKGNQTTNIGFLNLLKGWLVYRNEEFRQAGKVTEEVRKNHLMTSKSLTRVAICAMLSVAGLLSPTMVRGQTPAASTRFVGTITAVNGDTLTVKPDSGDVRQVQVPATAAVKRVEPGQKDLSGAE